jgi:tetratricopeptide (TPR) repeat protein
MMQRFRPLGLLLPALVLVAAAPASLPPEELVRQGNSAVGRQQYPDALKLYEQAEDRTTDPGLVAFNEGVAFFLQGNFVQAETHFRQACQGATGSRQVRATYNLAASLLRTAGDSDVAKLAEAVALFGDCLREDTDEGLAADARHNLELAKLLWAQAKARPKPPQEKPPPNDEEQKPQPPTPEPVKQPGEDDGSANPTKGSGQRANVTPEPGQEPIKTDGQQAPGENPNLPVIPDREELAPMSREEAEAHLRQAVEAVLQEGRTHRQHKQRVPSGRVRNW